jgi:hypothetical protein
MRDRRFVSKGAMRFIPLLSILALTACTATQSVAPREYLDEQTAATITVVAQPWVFTRRTTASQVDFFNLYALDVNRMGEHRKYFAVVHYWPDSDLLDDSRAPMLVLNAGSNELKLAAVAERPRQLGIAQPLDPSAPSSAQTWLYPIDREILQIVSQTRELAAALVSARADARYTVWRDGSSELSEFAAAFEPERRLKAED